MVFVLNLFIFLYEAYILTLDDICDLRVRFDNLNTVFRINVEVEIRLFESWRVRVLLKDTVN